MSVLRVVLLLLVVQQTVALRFYVESNGKKCLKEEIHRNVVLTGEYEFSEAIGHTASVHVTDTRGHTLYKRENFPETKGKFAFTADEYDIFEICISAHGPASTLNPSTSHSLRRLGLDQQKINREVSLVLKHGVEAKNYEDLAKAEKLKPLEVELRRLEDLSDSIVQDFAYMRQREEEMRSTNESTNARVLYLSVFSMLCLLGLATWQVLYLRRYFKAKKLIE
ncbi:integral membrane protein [Aphelenchoides avenae]|nr:integral membrane protein [Aphelenchus avenae]